MCFDDTYCQIGPYVALSNTQRLPGGILPIISCRTIVEFTVCHFCAIFGSFLYCCTVEPYHSPEVPYKCRTTLQRWRGLIGIVLQLNSHSFHLFLQTCVIFVFVSSVRNKLCFCYKWLVVLCYFVWVWDNFLISVKEPLTRYICITLNTHAVVTMTCIFCQSLQLYLKI